MAWLRFEAVLTKDGWIEPCWVQLEGGRLKSLGAEPPAQRPFCQDIQGYAIPGIPNGHSHAFQYAMSGWAENQPSGHLTDDFWSWREAMYRLALRIEPEQMQAIAAKLYSQMLKSGFTSVAEFHYLHHDRHGQSYGRATEMSMALAAAARQAGIHLTLIPVYYRTGGFDSPAADNQRRFLFQSVDHYLRFIDELRASLDQRVVVGHGIHSLRAASQGEIRDIINAGLPGPFHIHIAEQTKEVDDCLNRWGRRPVDWLLENANVGPSFSLIHATHMSSSELTSVAQSGATVVICPTTEANLGDGIFPLSDYLAKSGRWVVGTDSHVCTDALEELRWLDYVQRLRLQRRNPICAGGGEDSGEKLITSATNNGPPVMGRHTGFELDEPFDCLVMNASHAKLIGSPELRLAKLIFAHETDMLLGTMTNGRWQVIEGQHRSHRHIDRSFRAVMAQLSMRAGSP